jgi:hypothetical protein
MKDLLKQIRAPFVLNEKNEIIIIDNKSLHSSSRDAMSGTRTREFSINDTGNNIMSKNLFEAIESNEHVKYPVGPEEFLTLDRTMRPGHMFQLITNVIVNNFNSEYSGMHLYKDSIKLLINLFQYKSADRQFRIKLFEDLYQNENLISSVNEKSALKDCLVKIASMETDHLSETIITRINQTNYPILSDLRAPRNNKMIYFEELRNLVHAIDKYSLMNSYSFSINDFRQVLILMVTKFFKETKEYPEIFEFTKGIITERLVSHSWEYRIDNFESVQSMTNSDFGELVELLMANKKEYITSFLSSNPILVLELYRRSMNKDYEFTVENLCNFLIEVNNEIAFWPKSYDKELISIIKEISIKMDDKDIKRVISVIENYMESFKSEDILNYAVYPNIKNMGRIPQMSGKSQKYLELLFSEMVREDKTGILSDINLDRKETNLLYSAPFGGVYHKLSVFIATMMKKQEFTESLLREIYSDLFKAMISATKAERSHTIEIISFVINNKMFKDRFGNIPDERIVGFFEEMSKSFFKNSTIEKIMTAAAGNNRYVNRTYEKLPSLMFGKTYMEVANLLAESHDVRDVVKSTFIKMELN